MPFSEIKLILESTALKWMKKSKLAIEFVKRIQDAYALVVATISLGLDALMLESPISVCIRPLVVASTNSDEVL